MRKQKIHTVNLLDPMQPPQDTFTILYNWVFSVGKILLISVQVLVIIVFVVRLYMDRQNNDVTRSINDKVTILSQTELQEEEDLYRKLQILLEDMNSLYKEQPRNAKTIVGILDSIPNEITLEEFSFNYGRVSSTFRANTIEDFRQYENFLKQSPAYRDVRVNLEKTGETDSGVEFEISYYLTDTFEEEEDF